MNRYRLLLICTFSVLLVLASGCTGLRLGYQQADILLAWRANSYFDFDGDQRREFSTRLDRLLAWHRQEQLPEYASFLTTALEKAEPGVKAEDIDWLVDGFRSRYRVIVNRGAPDAAEALSTLSSEQIAHLQKQFAKDNRKFADDHEVKAGTEKRKRVRLKKTINAIEEWTGSLGREQEEKIAALLDPIPLIEHLRLQDRMRRQREFVEILKLRQAKTEFAVRLQQWLLDWDMGRAHEYEKTAAEVYKQRLQFYVAVDRLLTREQRQHALARLQKYIDDCKSLSARRAGNAGIEERMGTIILALFFAADHASL